MDERDCDKILSDPNRGKLVVDFRAVARRPIKFLRLLGPFLTAHHPLCSHFDGHVITIRNRQFCIGCLFNTISFFGSFIALLALWFLDSSLFLRPYLFWGGVVAVAASLFSSAIGLTEHLKVKIAAKFLLGSGFASLCMAILIIGDDLFVQIELKFILILILYLPVMTIMNGKRMWEIEKECADCEYEMRWSKCPGFKDIVCNTIEEGFLHPEKKDNE